MIAVGPDQLRMEAPSGQLTTNHIIYAHFFHRLVILHLHGGKNILFLFSSPRQKQKFVLKVLKVFYFQYCVDVQYQWHMLDEYLEGKSNSHSQFHFHNHLVLESSVSGNNRLLVLH